jgi:hypothetical protein
VLAGALGLALGADFFVRGKISDENDQSFAATGVQIQRAFQLLADRFDSNGNQMHHMFALRELTNYRDQFDFGLRSEEDDAKERQRIHEQLLSADWDQWMKVSDREVALIVGVADYKGRLFYTSASRGAGAEYFLADLTKISWFQNARESHGVTTMVLQSTDDTELATTKLLGMTPKFKLAFLYARTLFIGADNEPGSSIIQAVDASKLAEDIRLDKKMRLAIVAPNGVSASDQSEAEQMPDELIAAARDHTDVIEVQHAGVPYQVTSQNLTTRDGRRVGNVVMAREVGGVLSGFFPGARMVFATAALIALVLAIATAIQVRRLAR